MNARRRSLRCLALCALPVASVLAAVPAQAATREDSTIEAVDAGAALPLAGGVEAATEAEGTAEPEGGAEAEDGAGDGKDNGLGIGIIAASLVFGALAAPVIKLASLKQG